MTSDLPVVTGCLTCGPVLSDTIPASCATCGGPVRRLRDLRGSTWQAVREGASPGAKGLARWAHVLPVHAERLRLRPVGGLELRPMPKLAARLGLSGLVTLDAAAGPLGSLDEWKLGVTLAGLAEQGTRAITLATPGPAAGPGASLARTHELTCRVVLPAAASPAFRAEARLLGSRVVGVSGDQGAALAWGRDHAPRDGQALIGPWTTPFSLEGVRALTFEAFSLDPELAPELVVVPTGSGETFAGLALALDDLVALGRLGASQQPRLVAAQVEASPQLARAMRAPGTVAASPDATRRTLAEGIRVADCGSGMPTVLRMAAARGALGVVVEEPSLVEAIREAARSDTVLLGPEGAVALAAVLALQGDECARGRRVAVLNTTRLVASAEALAAAAGG